MELLGGKLVQLAVVCSCVWFATEGEVSYGLTAAHCIKSEGDQMAYTVDGKRFNARVVKIDRVEDVALLKCWAADVGSPQMSLGRTVVGAPVVLAGYPSGRLQVIEGEVTGRAVKIGDSGRRSVVETDTDIKGGFSGGAVVSESGLVGIVTHTVNGDAGCGLLDGFIDRQANRIVKETVTSAVESDPLPQIKLRDLIALVLGWFVRNFFAGRMPLPSPPKQG